MEKYDIIIIGAGPGGLTAGIYAGRQGTRNLIIDQWKTIPVLTTFQVLN